MWAPEARGGIVMSGAVSLRVSVAELLGRLEAGEGAGLEEDVERFLEGKRPPLSFETPRSMAAIGG